MKRATAEAMMRSRLRRRGWAWLLTLGVTLLVAATAAGSAAAPAWLPPRVLSLAGDDARTPAVALDQAGDALAVWLACDDAGCRVQQSNRPAGGEWSPAADVSERAPLAGAVSIAMTPGGKAVAAWPQLTATDWTILAAERSPGGVWEAPRALSSGAVDIGGVAVAIDRRGTAAAIWTDVEAQSGTVRAAVRRAGGTWSAPATLTPAGVNAGLVSVAFDAAGNATAVWVQDVRGTVRGVVYAARRRAGGAWSAGQPLSSPAESANGVALAVDPDGTAVVAWSAFNHGIRVVRRPAGGSWGSPRLLSAGGTDPATAVDPAGDALVLWEEGYTSVRSALRPPKGGWHPAVTVSPRGASPHVALDRAGNAVAIWVRFDSQGRQIEQAARRPAGGSWSRPTTITPPGGPESYGGTVVADPRGNAVAAIAGYLRHGIAEVVALDSAGPVLAKLSVPARARRGRRVRFSVAPFDVWSGLAGPPRWSFGDGALAVGTAVTHAYRMSGSYRVRVSQTDTVGNRTSVSRVLKVGG